MLYLKLFGLIVLVLGLITIMPLATIWAFNTLFGFAIPFAIDTWLAALLLGIFFRGVTSKSSS